MTRVAPATPTSPSAYNDAHYAPASPTSPSSHDSSSNGAGTGAPLSQVDELLLQISQLTDSLRSKNEDLAMAGDLGGVLLQHNEQALAKVDALQSQLDRSLATVSSLEVHARSQERTIKKLAAKHAHELDYLQAEHAGELEILKMELDIERGRQAASRAKNSEDFLKAHTVAQQQKQAELVGAQVLAELDALRVAATKAEQSATESRRQLAELRESLSLAREENAELKKETSRLSKVGVKLFDAQSELARLKALDSVNVLAELQWDNQRMGQAVQELNQALETMHESNMHDQMLLGNLQNKNEVSASNNNTKSSSAWAQVLRFVLTL